MTTLREAAEFISEGIDRIDPDHSANEPLHKALEGLRAVLAAEQEQADTDLLTYGTSVMKDGKRIDPKTIYLEANQAQAGWKLVPIEPTEAMLVAARDWSHAKYGKPVGNDGATGCYASMLKAAPEVK